ncbi:MAG: hypothetical protein U0V49_00775 [Saprospiraceae bacterium]
MEAKNQFLELFFQLNADEIKGFTRFIRSGQTKDHDFNRVLGIITRSVTKDIRALKIRIFESLHPGKSYDDLIIRVLLSDLLAKFKQYLVIRDQNPLEIEIRYLKFLRLKNLNRQFENQFDQVREKTVNEKIFNENIYSINYQLEFEKFRFETKLNRFNLERFSQLLVNFDHSVTIQKLKLYLEYLNFKNFIADSSEYLEFENQIQNLLHQDWSSYPEIQMNVLALKLFTEFENDAAFEYFSQSLNQYSETMDAEVRKDFYYTALNYCIRKINLGREDYFDQVLSLYDHGVNAQWILDNGYMSQVTYKNIVSLCIRMKEYGLAEELMLKYKSIIQKREQESIFDFNQARIFKAKGNIRQALVLLNSNRYKDPLIELHVRIELIKIYYEAREMNLLNSQIVSTTRFINKAGRFGNHKIYYLHFIQYVQALLAAKATNANPSKLYSLLMQIKKEPDLIERAWLVQVASYQ